MADSPSLDRAIARYQAALEAIDPSTPNVPLDRVLEVLHARDAVERILQDTYATSGKTLAQLVELDRRLKQHAGAIATRDGLLECRQSLRPPESAWWWHLEQPQPQQSGWARFDWAWNILTVIFLVFATANITQTARAFSAAHGFDFVGSFTTIFQGAGIVTIAGGALTKQGKRGVENVLASLNIRPKWHAELTCFAALGLLGVSHIVRANLDKVSEYYYLPKAQEYVKNERWLEGEEQYQRALNFTPDNPDIYVGLGRIYEALGKLQQAREYYEQGLPANNPASLNGVGRVLLLQAFQTSDRETEILPNRIEEAQFFFRLAIKYLDEQPEVSNLKLKTDIYTNLGLAALAIKQIEPAKSKFKQANLLEEQLDSNARSGMANCYLSVVQNETLGNNLFDTLKQGIIAGMQQGVAQQPPGEIAVQTPMDIINTCKQAKPETYFQYQLIWQILESLPSEITDPNAIAQLQQEIYNTINDRWTIAQFDRDLVYRIKVTKDGAIADYEPLNKVAERRFQDTPLPELFRSVPIQEPLAQFTLIFTSGGQIEISPWQEQ